MQTLFDTHLHAAWARDLPGLARGCAAAGLRALAVTTTPHEYLGARRALGPDAAAGAGGLWLAPGLHPWWVADGRCGEEDVGLACELVAGCRVVGEVGLDHSPAHVGADGGAAQARAFLAVCRACARTSDAASPKVLSVHAVRSAGAALDVLEESGALGACRCVLHWFSGSSEELVRARRAGCWLSFGERALATRRGREYARSCPLDRLLLETDAPDAAGADLAAGDVAASLRRALREVARLRGMAEAELADALARNARALLA